MHFDESFDLVVGSGCASVTAALAAKALGATRPVIVEKQALSGGSTAYSGGIGWLPNNPLLDDGNEADARAYLDAVVGPPDKASPVAKREAYLKEGPRAVQFLLDQGVKLIRVPWPDYYSDLPGGHKVGRCREHGLIAASAGLGPENAAEQIAKGITFLKVLGLPDGGATNG